MNTVSVIAAGTSVRFVPGGLDMTVEGPAPIEGRLWCVWRRNGRFYGGDFLADSLLPIDSDHPKTNLEINRAASGLGALPTN